MKRLVFGYEQYANFCCIACARVATAGKRECEQAAEQQRKFVCDGFHRY